MLGKKLRYLHVYLDLLFTDAPQDTMTYQHLQVELYAEYDYTRLIDFLRTSSAFDIQKAYAIVSARDLVPEMVYLLGRMGDNRKALMLIIDRLGDVERAMEFCKDQDDGELWEDLLKYAMDKPKFIVGMLESLGSFIDPVRLVRRIPDGLEIEGLKGALIKIISDYGVQISLREGCEKILVNDTLELFATLYRMLMKPVVIDGI
jgi:hypothetical protein